MRHKINEVCLQDTPERCSLNTRGNILEISALHGSLFESRNQTLPNYHIRFLKDRGLVADESHVVILKNRETDQNLQVLRRVLI